MNLLAWMLCSVLVCASTSCGDVSERAAIEANQGIVVGSVVDGRDGAPIRGATITFGNAPSVETDDEGRFELDPLPAGTEGTLRAIKEGRSGEVPVRALKPGQLNVVVHL